MISCGLNAMYHPYIQRLFLITCLISPLFLKSCRRTCADKWTGSSALTGMTKRYKYDNSFIITVLLVDTEEEQGEYEPRVARTWRHRSREFYVTINRVHIARYKNSKTLRIRAVSHRLFTTYDKGMLLSLYRRRWAGLGWAGSGSVERRGMAERTMEQTDKKRDDVWMTLASSIASRKLQPIQIRNMNRI